MTSVVISEESTLVAENSTVEVVQVEVTQAVFGETEVVTILDVGAQGPKGAPGPKGDKGEPGDVVTSYPADGAISGHRVVALNAFGRLEYASNLSLSQIMRVAGLSLNAASEGDPVQVKRSGEVTEPSWAWVLEQPVYLGVDGHLTQTAPASDFSVVVGIPITTTTLFVNIGIPIKLN